MIASIPSHIDLDEVVRNSIKDMHVKGFDYICLRRSPTETLKLYFFDGDVTKMPEVVCPHDHRYDFDTYVLAGASENLWFKEVDHQHVKAKPFNQFSYMTPLNGGAGFRFEREVFLAETRRETHDASLFCAYQMQAHELHTIRILENETVLMLRQFEDVVPVDKPTKTFCQGDAPTIHGLYNRFTIDEVIAKLKLFEERTKFRVSLANIHETKR